MFEAFFTYEFLQNAAVTGLLIGLVAPLLGVFIVIRRLSLIADALSHITLTGIAASLLIEKKVSVINDWNPIYMGMAFSVVGAVLIERIRKAYKNFEELAIPIILSGGIGLGVLLISLADGFNTDLFGYLFGSVAAVSRSNMWTVLWITVFVILLVFLFYKELFALSFDEEHARVTGVKGKWINLLFILLVALVIASSLQIVGILLVSALMTLPVASALKLVKSFKQAIFLSIFLGETAVIVGILSAYHLGVPPGGNIVMVAILILIVTLAYKKVNKKIRIKKSNKNIEQST
ncbi:metal ABC transporter permease [Saliterribacillus persicus]|uniref:Transcriptional regulator n=1 Tax=Saliterribacillus persicus TaxID=930114 RepID=A0A368XD55_9BACI|nr:metal ABC transporter permease [Saliterribacillus persicus]RCW65880.1 transcriptional regulator [Saliterribacillus persicus]